jgi:acetyl/propionyl-CoA carboxylase alpha subunit
VFDTILIANRGEIACRVIRTLARLGVRTVAIHSEADRDALHVQQADVAALVGPPPVAQSYLNQEAILAAAKEHGAQAIHPGYGLLSENAGFAEAAARAGLTFIGPPPDVLRAFGDKIRAREVARAAGVSPPPGTPEPVPADDADALARAAEDIGFPLLVKAAGGGGGIGMQRVDTLDKLARAAAACADRGKSAFGDARVYLERYVESPKHIEVQILCDQHGQAFALGERECSMQRRHQKILEESPSPAPFFAGEEGAARRRALLEHAVAIAKSVGYVGAGTVEFVASATGELFFLEVNARLQVEHCVTEMVTGLDLVEQQVRVALGERLDAAQMSVTPRGHAVEARVYAEDPSKRFAPQPGHLASVVWPAESADLRVETGVRTGLDITPYYDPMIAKLVAHGADRAAAILRLERAIADTTIELVGPAGPAATNLRFLGDLLRVETFLDGSYDTGTAEAAAKSLKQKS